MAYKILLLDLDNTLLDFTEGTRHALTEMLAPYGMTLTEELLRQYLALNDQLWLQYELGEIEKTTIYSTRFSRFFGDLGISCDPMEANAQYARGLSESAVFLPHARELLAALQGRFRLFAVTNGVTTTQLPRLRSSGLDQVFERVFISEQMGCKKPEKQFFDQVIAAIGEPDRRSYLLIGDSLSSDMQGGRNAGIDTCFYGPDPHDDRCDYVAEDLLDVLRVLGIDN